MVQKMGERQHLILSMKNQQGRETNFFIVDRVDRERSRGFRGAVELDGTLQEAEFPEVVVLTARV